MAGGQAAGDAAAVTVTVGTRPPLLRWLARHPYAFLALFCFLLWTPGVLSLPALDRDESRFAQSSRQMLDSGNYVDIRFGHVPRYKKPVGIYWLQAAATALAGRGNDSHIWTYRLPSLLGGLAAAWLTFWCATAVTAAEEALLAALLMASSVLLTAEATIATTDAVLLATVMGTQGVLLRVYCAARAGRPPPSTLCVMAGWASLSAGLLVKGPVTPAVAAATIAALAVWDRQWRWLAALKPVRGLLLTALLVAPWLIAIAVQSHGAFFQQSLGHDFAAKIAAGQESHGAFPGYFLLLSAATFWPAILFVAPAIGMAVVQRGVPEVRFLLAWAGASWLMFEAVPTKLPHYVLPAYPALAILAAFWLLRRDKTVGWRRALVWIAALQYLVGLAALVVAGPLLCRLYGPPQGCGWLLPAASVAGGICGLAALFFFGRGRRLAAFIPALAAGLILIPSLTALAAPRLQALWVSERLGAMVLRYRQAGDPPPVLAGFEEPSLVFALGADVGLTDGAGAAEWGAGKGGLALVEDSQAPDFQARLHALRAIARPVGDLTGFNYSRGRKVHVTLFRFASARSLAQPHMP